MTKFGPKYGQFLYYLVCFKYFVYNLKAENIFECNFNFWQFLSKIANLFISKKVAKKIWSFSRSASKSYPTSTLLKAYKLIGIVEMLNNSCVRGQLFPAFALLFPSIQLSSGYVCIKLHDTLSLPAFAYFALIYIDCIILITAIFTAPSHVYISSKNLILKWKSDWRTSRKSGLRRETRTLNPIKVRFGSNFVDNSTPLVIQDMCTRTTVSTLLISG